MSAVECFPAFVVVRPEGIDVLLSLAPHIDGEHVVWEDANQRFYSPSHGEAFDVTGRVLQQPAMHGMWRCPVVIRDGRIYVGDASDDTADELVAACKANGHA